MENHIIFVSYLLIFIFSNIGYGYLFTSIFFNRFKKLNFGELGILGFFVIVVLSYSSSYIFAHNYIHNLIIHSIGIIFFLNNFYKSIEENKFQLKKIIIIFLVLLSGIYVFKNHDDFPYYHLTYALNLSNDSFFIGTGVLGHGFRTASSIFYYHSTLYLPLIKFYLFHSGPFLILIYFNYIVLSKIIKKFKSKSIDLVYYFSLLSLIFIDVAFYRIGEHGTDRSGQLLLLLAFVYFLELFFLEKKTEEKEKLFNYLLILIFLSASTKVLYILYLLLIPFVYFKSNFYKNYSFKKNTFLIFFLTLSLSLNLSVSFFSTGCLVYPEEKTCFNKDIPWSTEKNEVKQMKIHYEWWAKGGGGPGYSSEIKKETYIKDFIWLNNWIERHFFNKVSDTLLGIIFIAVLSVLFFYSNKKKYIKRKSLWIIYLIIFCLFIEWFFNHPSMRYGGYILFGLPIFFFTSRLIEQFNISKKRIYYSSIFLIILTIITFNIRNFSRLHLEINQYGYNLLKSPFFFVKDVKYEITDKTNDVKLYKTADGEMCWATPTPCTNRSSLKITNFKGFKAIIKE